MTDLKPKFQGALLGTFVGDALGMPVEGWSPQTIANTYGQIRNMLEARLGKGTYTDDTQMMIGIAESLLNCNGFNGEDIAQRFLKNYDPKRGYGSGTVQALQLIRRGKDWRHAAKKVFDGGSYGNGAAMRIAPIGVFYYDDPHLLREKAYASSQITHAHPLGKECAALQAFAVARALLTDPDEFDAQSFFDDLTAFVEPEALELVDSLTKVKNYLDHSPDITELAANLGNDSRAYISVPAAIYAFLSHPDAFEEATVYAISIGGDTDTIGAMTGAVAGALHGVNRIPERWLADLENGSKGRDYVIRLANQLYDIKMR